LKNQIFDLILLDLIFPDGRGHGLVEILRHEKTHPNQ